MMKKTLQIERQESPEVLMMGYLCVKDLESIPAKVRVLDRFNISDSAIAAICDCATQSVRNARLRKGKG